MIRKTLSSLPEGFRYLFKDKINFLLTLAPISIGIILYYYVGIYMYENILGMGKEYINNQFDQGVSGSIVYYFVAIVLTVILYFIINWTFVLLVSAVASPFNDQLSNRIEKQISGEKVNSISQTFGEIFKGLFKTLFNEFKKVFFILFFTIIAFVFSYIPILTPISLVLSAWLLATQFVDYTWSRHDLTAKECVKDVRNNMIPYGISGAFFFFLVSVPGLNLIVPPLATSYYTVYWFKKNYANRS